MKVKENDAKQHQNQNNAGANFTEFIDTTKIYITHVFFCQRMLAVFAIAMLILWTTMLSHLAARRAASKVLIF